MNIDGSDDDDVVTENERECAIDMRQIDLDEKEAVDKFFENGCGCTLFDGKPCFTAFSKEHISFIRDEISSLDRNDRYNLLFGHVMATVRVTDTVERNGRPTKDRERVRGVFLHEGMKVLVRF